MFKAFMPLRYPLAPALAEAVRIADRDGRQSVEVIDLVAMLGWLFKKRRSSFGSAWMSAVQVAKSKTSARVSPADPPGTVRGAA